MGEWKVIRDLDQGYQLLSEVDTRLGSTGVEKIAAKASVAMKEASVGAFSGQADPRTGTYWAPLSEATLRDKRGPKRPLHRTGELEGDVVSGYKLTPGGARAFVNIEARSVRKGLINLYGVEAKTRRTYTRDLGHGRTRQESTKRKHPRFVIPARRFVGLSDAKVGELVDYADATMTEGLP